MSTTMKPFLKWAGGKRQLLPEITKRLPPEGWNTFYEPFVGAGAVFLSLTHTPTVINDYNDELITTYKTIRDELPALLEKLEEFSHMNDKENFLSIRSWDVEGLLAKASSVERAARMIYLNKTCFNGMYRVNRFGHFNVPFADNQGAKILEKGNLTLVSEFLQKGVTSITQGDYSLPLEACQAGDFIYFDPPYASENEQGFVAYTDVGFGAKEQEELRDVLVDLDKRGCYWMYSNASVTSIHKLFESYKATTFIVQASRNINSKGSGRGKVPEVLITNYSPKAEGKTLFDF